MLLNKIVYYIIGIVITALLFTSGYLFYKNNQLENSLRETQDSLYVAEQNSAYYSDQLNMIADTVQNFAVKVGNLQEQNIRLKSDRDNLQKKYNMITGEYDVLKQKYFVLTSDYQILLDSIIVQGEVEPVITDKFIIIPFSGKEGKVTYNGKTLYNKVDESGEYEITITTDPISIESNIYLDEDNILRNEIYADGTLIDNANTQVDSAVYIMLRRSEPQFAQKMGFWDKFYVGGSIGFSNEDITKATKLDLYEIYWTGWLSFNITDNSCITFEKTLFDKSFLIEYSHGISIADIFK